MKVLYFGVGNIGCGFIGKLLVDVGIELMFVDVNQIVFDVLNVCYSYQVYVVGENEQVDIVFGVNVVSSIGDEVVDLIVEVDLVIIVVGFVVFECIVLVIVKGLVQCKVQGIECFLNIIVCENMVCGIMQLKGYVFNVLVEEDKVWVEVYIGFVDFVVDCIVLLLVFVIYDLLEVIVEIFSEWIVDKIQFKGVLLIILGMELIDNLMVFVECKFFILNIGYVIIVYFGKLVGYQMICDVIFDQKICVVVQGVMEESGVVLIKCYVFDLQKYVVYIQKIFGCFENLYLKDDVECVGCQLLCKLSVGDCLIKLLLGILEYGLLYCNLVKGIVVVMYFCSEDDLQVQELVVLIVDKGLQVVLVQIFGLDVVSDVVVEVVNDYNVEK